MVVNTGEQLFDHLYALLDGLSDAIDPPGMYAALTQVLILKILESTPDQAEAEAESKPVMTRLNGGRQLRIPKEAGYDCELFEVGALG